MRVLLLAALSACALGESTYICAQYSNADFPTRYVNACQVRALGVTGITGWKFTGRSWATFACADCGTPPPLSAVNETVVTAAAARTPREQRAKTLELDSPSPATVEDNPYSDGHSYGTSKCAEPCPASGSCPDGCKCSGFLCVKDDEEEEGANDMFPCCQYSDPSASWMQPIDGEGLNPTVTPSCPGELYGLKLMGSWYMDSMYNCLLLGPY